jgi:TetR/AcrR family transcriptional repressor of nem operon
MTVTARDKLMEAAVAMVREKGFAATSVDDLCKQAGVTKGAFFHHFATKEQLGVEAARHWDEMTSAFFAAQAYRQLDDPLERVLGYIDFRREILAGEVSEFTCLVGTMVQEAYQSAPAIRDACDVTISRHAAVIEQDIAAAIEACGINPDGWDAKGLALHMQAVLQGAFILAKAKGGPEVAVQSIDHLKRYVSLLFRKETVH